MTQQDFINIIAPSFQKWGKQFGYKIVSAGIAQACLESGYGTSYKAIFGHNILGLKYRPNRITCNDGYFEDGGSEQNPDGSYTPLPSSTAWYNFKDWDACIHGYYEFINTPNYAAVKASTDALSYLQNIKAAGYATSKNYVDNVYKVIQKWNLTKYDNFAKIDSSTSDIKIIQSPGIQNLTNKPNRTIEYIVLHYTAGTSSKAGTARNIAAYFNKATTKASADFIVDEAEIVQYNQNIKNYYTWAVGGSIYSNKSTSLSGAYYGKCSNQNSISIEMCSNKVNTKTLNASDDDWFITDKVVDNAAKLVKYLMQQYNIDIHHVIMHHQVTGKWCPQPWVKNELALHGWYNFLNKVQAGAGSSISLEPSSTVSPKVPAPASAYPQVPFLVQVLVPNLNIRKTPNGEKTGKVTGIGKFTIIDCQGDWGLLKSKAGWIYLANPQYTKF